MINSEKLKDRSKIQYFSKRNCIDFLNIFIILKYALQRKLYICFSVFQKYKENSIIYRYPTSMFQEYLSLLENYQTEKSFTFEEYTQINPMIQQINKIQQQTNLMQRIMSKLNGQCSQSVLLQNTSINNIMIKNDDSFIGKSQTSIGLYSLSHDLNNYSFSYHERLKFGNQGLKSIHEVKQKCSPQTYRYFSKLIQQQKKMNKKNSNENKNKKENQKLIEENLILKHQISKFQTQIDSLRQEIQKLTLNLKSIQTKKLQIQKLEKKLLNKQQGLIYQKKICSNLQKFIETKIKQFQYLKQTKDHNTAQNSQNSSDSQTQDSCSRKSNHNKSVKYEKSQLQQFKCLVNKVQKLIKL